MHILKNYPKKWVNSRSIVHTTKISHNVLMICCHCFFASIYEKWFPSESNDGQMHSEGGGGTSMLAHSVCAALHGRGL